MNMNIRSINFFKISSSALLLAGMTSAPSTTQAATESEYEQRLQEFEQRLDRMEQSAPLSSSSTYGIGKQVTGNAFNPAISVIIDGVYADYKNDPEDYALPGFALGGEAGLAPQGFSLGHSEIVLSNNIDDKFYGQFTLAIIEHEGELEIELEEAFFETLALGYGFTIRGGRFYSGLGYLNQQHQHQWNFQDAPLIYRGLFGNQYLDDGIRVSYVAPTDLFFEIGGEAFTGHKFPAGGEHEGLDSLVGFVNLGGDIGTSHSWQTGVSYWQADNIAREYGGHAHGHAGDEEVPHFEGDSTTIGLNAVYKWAPDGNYRDQNFKLQFEYFQRDDKGNIELEGSDPLEESSLDGSQDGWYLQGIWQFTRGGRVGARYDAVDSDNNGSDPDVLDEAGLLNNGHKPERVSLMTEWVPSEFSRIRLQYNKDDSYQVSDDQIFLQYTFSIGAHGAHAF